MDPGTRKLRQELRRAGLSDRAIDAAWPRWWSDDAAESSSARAELRFTLARRLGISPKSLSGDGVVFIWKDEARFKNLAGESDAEKDALASFGTAIGRIALEACSVGPTLNGRSAEELRAGLLGIYPFVDLRSLLAACWGLGIPVVHLRVFPLEAKSMHAMVVQANGRYAILLGKDASYPAPVAFALAHEMAHVALGHLAASAAIVEVGDPADANEPDDEERQADRYALELLTGASDPVINTNLDKFGARQLAAAALDAGPRYRIEPGTLALCYAYRTKHWAKAQASLHHIYSESKPVWREVNHLVDAQLKWSDLTDDAADYLRIVMDAAND